MGKFEVKVGVAVTQEGKEQYLDKVFAAKWLRCLSREHTYKI